MIVGPHKGVFFIATALMCSASLYGAESVSASDPMTRLFVGEPNRLTVPPGFPGALAEPALGPECEPRVAGVATDSGQSATAPVTEAQHCAPHLTSSVPLEVEPPVEPPVTDRRVTAQPASAASTLNASE